MMAVNAGVSCSLYLVILPLISEKKENKNLNGKFASKIIYGMAIKVFF